MSANFKLGDICIGQNHIIDIEYNGMEALIVAPYGMYSWSRPQDGEGGEGMGYLVQWEDGETCFTSSFHLRLKQPPRSAKSIMREAILKAKQPLGVPA